MKNYRVWEANRKIWLYPENWIEPELRDDKTTVFQELESELQQSDLDNAAAEQALMHYLREAHEVGHLEIAGTYEDDDGTCTCSAARSTRRASITTGARSGDNAAWTPWEQVDLDIEGDHLIPVVWNSSSC